MKMKICYSNPTILLKRPIAEIIERLGDKHELTLLIPVKDKKLDSSMHYSKVKKARVLTYKTLQLPISSEWPVPGPKYFKLMWETLKQNDVIHMWVPFYLSNTILAITKGLFFREKKLILTMDTIPGYSFSMGEIMDAFFKIYYMTIGQLVFSFCDFLEFLFVFHANFF